MAPPVPFCRWMPFEAIQATCGVGKPSPVQFRTTSLPSTAVGLLITAFAGARKRKWCIAQLLNWWNSITRLHIAYTPNQHCVVALISNMQWWADGRNILHKRPQPKRFLLYFFFWYFNHMQFDSEYSIISFGWELFHGFSCASIELWIPWEIGRALERRNWLYYRVNDCRACANGCPGMLLHASSCLKMLMNMIHMKMSAYSHIWLFDWC